MRSILFVLYTIETVLNLWALAFHVGTYISLNNFSDLPEEEYQQYLFSIIFQFITVLTMFSSIGLCTGNFPSFWLEALRTSAAFMCNIFLSIATMYDTEVSGVQTFVVLQQKVHPFLKFMKGQSICSLLTGSVNLLHCILIIDIMMSYGDTDAISNKDDAETFLTPPVKIYFLGAWVTKRLDKYDWFKVSTERRRISI